MKRKKEESGYSLLEILVASGVLLGFIMVLTKIVSSGEEGMTRNSTRQEAQGVESIFRELVFSSLNDALVSSTQCGCKGTKNKIHVGGPCISFIQYNKEFWPLANESSRRSFLILPADAKNPLVPQEIKNPLDPGNKEAMAAYERCKDQTFLSGKTLEEEKGLYQCFTLAPGPEDVSGSFLSKHYVFAEVYVGMFSLAQNRDVTCNEFKLLSSAERGSKFFVQMYFRPKSRPREAFQIQRISSFNRSDRAVRRVHQCFGRMIKGALEDDTKDACK